MTQAAAQPSARVAVAGVMVAVFLFAIDATIVSSAMPTVVSQLGGLDLYSWVFSVYMLTSALATPIFGKLSDLYSRRTLILLAIGTFVVGSAACGAAQSMTQLIVFRAVQGMGGGAVYALAFIIVGVVFPPEQRRAHAGAHRQRLGRRFRARSGRRRIHRRVLGLALDLLDQPAVGRRGGGAHYRGFPGGTRATHAPLAGPGRRRPPPFGADAAVLRPSGGGQPDRPRHRGVPSRWVVGVVVLLVLLVAIEGKARDPLLPMALFRISHYSRPAYLSLLAAMGIFGFIGFLPLYVQGALGGKRHAGRRDTPAPERGMDRREPDRGPGHSPLGLSQGVHHRDGPDGDGLHPVHAVGRGRRP